MQCTWLYRSTRLNTYRQLHYHKIVQNEHYVSTSAYYILACIPIITTGLP